MIAIIDYDMGNLYSVENVLKYLGAEYVVTRDRKTIESCEGIIFPGVGSFDKGMKNLEKFDLIETLRDQALNKKKPILGICVGMQVMASYGYEGGKQVAGLNLIPGEVVEMHSSKEFKIPHVGFNEVSFENRNYIFDDLDSQADFYFVHSYRYVVENRDSIIGLTKYGVEIVSGIQNENIIGLQFHPEKSQSNGLIVFKNFIDKVKNNA